jgi:P27 family predicted phage terminase small subunit
MKGTLRTNRHGKREEQAAVLSESVEDSVYPDYLEEDCYPYFDIMATRLANAGMYSTHYTDALAVAAQQMKIIKDTTEILLAEGTTYESANGTLKIRPEQTMREHATDKLIKLLSDMGLTLIGSQRLRKQDVVRKQEQASAPRAKAKDKDPWDQLRPGGVPTH